MAQNHQSPGDLPNMTSSNQVISSSTQNNETSSQSQQHTSGASEPANPFDGIRRTESGRETYHPDGQQPSDQAQAQRPTSRGSYGLYPNTQPSETHTSDSFATGGLASAGAGLFQGPGPHAETTRDDQYLRQRSRRPRASREDSDRKFERLFIHTIWLQWSASQQEGNQGIRNRRQ